MLDHNLFLNDFELTSKALLRKGISSEMIEEARDAIQKRRECQQETEVVRADLNKNSKMIGELIRKGEKAQAEDAKKAVEATKAKLHEKEAELKSVEDAFHQCTIFSALRQGPLKCLRVVAALPVLAKQTARFSAGVMVSMGSWAITRGM